MMPARQEVLAYIASRIAEVRRAHTIRVAIDGVDAAGKTTLANELAPLIDALGHPVIRASIDGFHNPQATRHRRGSLSPEGYFYDSFNYAALIEALLQPLGPGGSGLFRRAFFDFRTDEPVVADAEMAPAEAVLLLDGVFLLRPELRDYFDYSVFVQADFAVTIRRAEQRDVTLFGDVGQVQQRYRERYVPGQQLYLRAARPERWASIILDNNDPTAPQIQGAV